MVSVGLFSQPGPAGAQTLADISKSIFLFSMIGAVVICGSSAGCVLFMQHLSQICTHPGVGQLFFIDDHGSRFIRF
jgi:hypothetical protein